MIDIETLATGPDAVVLSIGATAFSLEGLAPVQFYSVMDMSAQNARTIDPDTVKWWMQQQRENDGAADVFDGPREPLIAALDRFTNYVQTFLTPTGGVWANGPDFDCVILRTLFDDFGLKTPWRHTQHRCFRTLKALCRSLNVEVQVEDNMHMHNALADADWQARYTIAALKGLGVLS
jgi:hypothetical protein